MKYYWFTAEKYRKHQSTQVKKQERIFSKDWKEEYVVLFNDSTLVWFKDKDKMEPEGSVIIKNAPELMAYGPFTARVPKRPALPNGYRTSQLLAFGTKGKEAVYWFLCKHEEDVMSWMTTISNLLPPPPARPSSQLHDFQGCQGCSRHTFLPSSGLSQQLSYGYVQQSEPVSNVPISDRQNNGDLAMSIFLGSTMGWGLGRGWNEEWVNSFYDAGAHWYDNGDHHFSNNESDVNHESIGIHDDAYEPGGLDSTDFDMCADFGAF
ncbi:uncharacterized protein LOC106457738 isoform X1 [Limulus polyphemus]|uniref:Uncharacterized protein LOC106457738 isoform X1 n=1 Tax=Limulus polyphemus TaxID=6850 RepID=A0ABM1S761_LIMPO|nr:uncharacterized protein LOC106457738 isoform X1 [Limulus polyphemus]